MIVLEYFFKKFHSRGSYEYLQAWAIEVDVMAAEGWKVLDCCRHFQCSGFWTVVLGRPAREFGGEHVESRFEEGEE